MDRIFNIGTENRIEGIEKINADQVKDIEPYVESIGGIWVPCTGIIDFVSATKKMVELALAINKESKLFMGCEVKDVEKKADHSILHTSKGAYKSSYQVFCGGLQADRLAKKDGVDLKEKVVGFEEIIMS